MCGHKSFVHTHVALFSVTFSSYIACFLAFLLILTNYYHTAKEILIPDACSCIIYRHPVVKLVWVCIVVSFGRRGFVRCPRVGRMNAADLFSNILTYTCISIVATVCIFSPSVWYIIDFPQKISCHFFFFQSCNRLKEKKWTREVNQRCFFKFRPHWRCGWDFHSSPLIFYKESLLSDCYSLCEQQSIKQNFKRAALMFLAKNFMQLLIFCTDNSVAVQTVDHSCRKYWIYDCNLVNPGGLNSTFPNLILLKDPELSWKNFRQKKCTQKIVKNQPDTSDGSFLIGTVSFPSKHSDWSGHILTENESDGRIFTMDLQDF